MNALNIALLQIAPTDSLGRAVKPEPRFEKADFCSSIVKILANTYSIRCVFAAAEQKSALFKISDRKARRFREIFVSTGRSNADALRARAGRKAPKYTALRRVRV